MKYANVLVTAAGSIIAQGIIKSLRLANIQRSSPVTYRIFTTDINAQAAGLYRADVGVLIPRPTSPDYVDRVIKICNENKIDAVFVGSDEELMTLVTAKEQIENDTKSVLIANPEKVIRIASDKWTTYTYLKERKIFCAESALPEDREAFIRKFGFPLVVKPREGHGSLHFYVVNNNDEMKYAISSIQKAGWRPMLQEYLDGEDNEFTSGVTVDREGKHVMSSISMRKTLKGGQTYKAFIDDYDSINKCAEDVAIKIGARGSINIQSKLMDDKPKIFEINPRFSATCPLRATAGVNEPDIIFRNVLLNEKIRIRDYRKLVCMRYWNEVYVPISTYDKTKNDKVVQNSDAFIPNYF
ncbi:MAG: ATP-grasp domain-containing protein [Candidatus Nitrosotenuis sp.]|nr:MAG: ATP-grasp domain-containing protein [Candidatus Nitrosotenuis sp.]